MIEEYIEDSVRQRIEEKYRTDIQICQELF